MTTDTTLGLVTGTPLDIIAKPKDGSKPIKIRANTNDSIGVSNKKFKKKKQKLGSMTLSHRMMKNAEGYKVPDGSVLDLDRDKEEDTMKVTVKAPKREQFSMSCNPEDTVEQLKDAIEEEQGITI